MQLEDALVCVVLEAADRSDEDLIRFCSSAIEGGVDMVRLRMAPDLSARTQRAQAVCDTCRDGDIFIVIQSDAVLAATIDACGVHLADDGGGLGQARAELSDGKLVGMSSRSVNDTRLALELEPDYLVHEAGDACPGDFAMLGSTYGIPLFAGGIDGVDGATRIVGPGVVRLSVSSDAFDWMGDITEQAAAYSRVLGRCL